MTIPAIALRTKLTLLSLGLVILTTTAIASWVIYQETASRYQDLVHAGTTSATMVALSSEYALYTENQDALRQIVAGLRATPDIAYVVVRSSAEHILLQQVFDSTLSLPSDFISRHVPDGRPSVEHLALRPDTAAYIDIIVPVTSRSTISTDPLSLDPLTSSTGSTVLGHIQLGLSQQGLQEHLHQFLIGTTFIVLLVLTVGLILTVLLTKSITNPILSLVDATELVAKGRFDVDVSSHTRDEVSRLAEAFNRMTAHLRASQAQVREYHQGLEAKVAERTHQLEASTQEARHLAEAAQAASRAKSQFLANMSHEIRTPMNGVMGMTELLSATSLDTRQRHLTESIQRSGEALLAVINDILDFSKIEAGKLQLEHLDFDVQETVEEAVELFATAAQRKGLELTCRMIEPVQRMLRGDPVRLRQALLNLLSNAVKFTEHGEINLCVEVLSEASEAVTLRFTVKDSGIGIPQDAQARVFEAFSQADGTTTRRFGGTGLGLTIVKELVSLMQGQMGLESRPGQGSTFWFTAVFQRQTPVANQITKETLHLHGRRILVVDDTATNREILDAHLRSWNAAVTSVASGHEALATLQAAISEGHPFDLAILDLQMPVIDGRGLAEAIRSDSRFEGLRLMMLTSVGYKTDTVDASLVDSWATKPVRKSLLYQALLGLCRGTTRHQAPDPAPSTPLLPAAQSTALRLLLVEDTPVNREVALGMLELLGHHVDIATNGLKAVEAIARKPYDLVLMDCQMPVMDGFTATATIRTREQAAGKMPRLPIIALTAHAIEGDRERCLSAGMDDYLTKPYTLPQLQDFLARWSDPARATAQSQPPDSPKDLPNSESSTAPVQTEIDETAWSTIRALQRPGQPDILHKTLRLYLTSSAELITTLVAAVHQTDTASATIAAHTLKSSSATLGARPLADLCFAMEQAGKAGDGRRLTELLPRVVSAHQAVCDIFTYTLDTPHQEAA